MTCYKELRKHQLKVRKLLKNLNKQLKEDCFAGRFEVKQTKRIDRVFDDGVATETGIDSEGNTFVAGHGYPLWHSPIHEIEFIDHECPERNFKDYFDEHEVFNGFPNGSKSVLGIMNDFIVKSDFWEKWNKPEYKKTHWFSGEELKRVVEMHGPSWASADLKIKSDKEKEMN